MIEPPTRCPTCGNLLMFALSTRAVRGEVVRRVDWCERCGTVVVSTEKTVEEWRVKK